MIKNLILMLFLLSCLNACNGEMGSRFDVSYLHSYLKTNNISQGTSILYENGKDLNVVRIIVADCDYCFDEKNNPEIIASYVSLFISEQGIDDYDGIEVHFKTGEGKSLEKYFPKNELVLIKKMSSSFLISAYQKGKPNFDGLNCFVQNRAGVNSVISNKDYISNFDSIRSRWPQPVVTGYIISNNGKKVGMLYQLSNRDNGYGSLFLIYDLENNKTGAEILMSSDIYRTDVGQIGYELDQLCSK